MTTQASNHDIQITSESYLYNNAEIPFDQIPPNSEYICYKLNENGAAEYFEIHTGSKTTTLMSRCADENYLQRAKAILKHAMDNGLEADHTLIIRIIIDQGKFKLDVKLVGTEQSTAIAIFKISDIQFQTQGKTKTVSTPEIESVGFIVEIGATDPMPMNIKRLNYNSNRELLNIEYVLYSLNENLLLDTKYTFTELSELGESLVRQNNDSPKSNNKNDSKIYMPICNQQYLDEVDSYINFELVAHVDLTGNLISDEEMSNTAEMYHRQFHRQWFNNDHKLKMNQVMMLQGIAHTDIFDVPQDKHIQTVHAYLRRIHNNKDLISLDTGQATYYVVMYEPYSTESSATVPLEAGQYKRNASIYSTLLTNNGFNLVSCECIVFAEDDKLLKKYTFSRPGEQQLMHEETFNFDDNGNQIES